MTTDPPETTYEVRISGLTERQARTLARIKRGGAISEIWICVPSPDNSYYGGLFTRVFDSSNPDLVDNRYKDWW